MTWKNGRRLATFTKGDVSASFDYDADGLRTTKTVGTSRVDYYRAGGLLLGEVHTDGDESYTINYMYDESGRMLGFRLDGAEYYYVRDYSGDVTGLINSRGELIGSYLYDPWGVLLETYLNTFEEETAEWTDADRAEYMRVLNLNPIRYKSYYYDTETGFYYLRSRYYDPITTRFISPDTVDVLTVSAASITDRNLYAYCDNNPIVRYDDGGELWHILAGAIVGSATSLITSIVDEAVNYAEMKTSSNESNWNIGKAIARVAISTVIGGGEGAAIAACPAAAAAIGAAAGATDSIINDLLSDDDITAQDVIIGAAVSGALGALTNAGGGSFSKIGKNGKVINEAGSAITTLVSKNTIRPIAKKKAKKALVKGVKRLGRAYVREQAESVVYYGLDWLMKESSNYYAKNFR